MSSAASPPSSSSLPPPPPPKSGIRAALEYTGIPPSWFSKRPKLPSRNWLIFLSVTSSIAGTYIYDRKQCTKIRQKYIERVKHLADEKLEDMQWARKVTVYGSKWPGDEDYDRSMKYFRKYVKPIFVAAAIDYEMINGKRHGDLSRKISDKIKAQRRLDAGLDHPPQYPMKIPTRDKPVHEKRRHELEGGVVVIGRHTFKEYMAGLKRGWTEGLDVVDREERLARELADDGVFDEPPEEDEAGAAPSPLKQQPIPNPPKKSISPSPPTPPTPLPPSSIPQQPPLLLIPFTNYIGFTQIPHMLFDFFTQRYKVRAGAEAAYRLIMNHTRPFVGPSSIVEFIDATESAALSPATIAGGDLDFDSKAESYYKSTTSAIPTEITTARTKYYASLPETLSATRALSRGLREPTKDEQHHPPKTEVELRAERLKKELRWRGDSEGWDIVRPDVGVVWDERLRGSLNVFIDPPKDEGGPQ